MLCVAKTIAHLVTCANNFCEPQLPLKCALLISKTVAPGINPMVEIIQIRPPQLFLLQVQCWKMLCGGQCGTDHTIWIIIIPEAQTQHALYQRLNIKRPLTTPISNSKRGHLDSEHGRWMDGWMLARSSKEPGLSTYKHCRREGTKGEDKCPKWTQFILILRGFNSKPLRRSWYIFMYRESL